MDKITMFQIKNLSQKDFEKIIAILANSDLEFQINYPKKIIRNPVESKHKPF